MRHPDETVTTYSTRKESASRSIGDFGPGINGWQITEFQVKITLTKTTSQTDLMMHIFKRGEEFWFPADMAAQCAIFGHGCAGHHYCAHCMAHANGYDAGPRL
jgi:hypothetical protein